MAKLSKIIFYQDDAGRPGKRTKDLSKPNSNWTLGNILPVANKIQMALLNPMYDMLEQSMDQPLTASSKNIFIKYNHNYFHGIRLSVSLLKILDTKSHRNPYLRSV